MSALEAIGLVFIVYMALSGLAAHIYFAGRGFEHTRMCLKLGRVSEDSAIRDDAFRRGR